MDDLLELTEKPVAKEIFMIAGWRQWAKSCALPMFASAEVLRSGLCLKLHAYHDTGAIIAAATTSIPEAMGTMRKPPFRQTPWRQAKNLSPHGSVFVV